ncbi:MAG: alpha/beta hydrolase [Rhodospirillales bacterium]|nr:alpha/beta hydrolase [Rhodospirillales bacterium]
MADLSSIFDRTGAVRRPDYAQLLHELGALLNSRPEPPPFATLPNGRGQVALVLPGFLTSDLLTLSLRQFLTAQGFRPFGWQHGVNVGPTTSALLHLRDRVRALSDLNDGPIAVIGVSLGGLLARDLAYDCPERIRHVVTLASPFRLPTASTFEPLVRMCGPLFDAELNIARLSTPLPMPSTAFFTRDDGVVAWESCRSDDPDCANFEVTGRHMTICRNPEVLTQIVHALAKDVR